MNFEEKLTQTTEIIEYYLLSNNNFRNNYNISEISLKDYERNYNVISDVEFNVKLEIINDFDAMDIPNVLKTLNTSFSQALRSVGINPKTGKFGPKGEDFLEFSPLIIKFFFDLTAEIKGTVELNLSAY